MKLSKLIKRTLYNQTYKNLISHFFEEVVDDIKLLNDDKMYSENLNETVKGYYNKEDFIITAKYITEDKYKEEYCPTSLFKYFNQSEKMHYIMLRVEIDNILGIKDTSYKI
jgi:hypothetical protein